MRRRVRVPIHPYFVTGIRERDCVGTTEICLNLKFRSGSFCQLRRDARLRLVLQSLITCRRAPADEYDTEQGLRPAVGADSIVQARSENPL